MKTDPVTIPPFLRLAWRHMLLWLPGLAIVAGGVALIVLMFVIVRGAPVEPLIPPAMQRTIDSLRATHATDSLHIDSLVRAATEAQALASRATERARALEAASARSGARADTLAAEARRNDPTAIGAVGVVNAASDTIARLWRAAYDARTAERDTLASALHVSQQAYAEEHAAAEHLRAGLADSEARAAALDALNSGLITQLASAERRCRFLIFPCPSRTSVAIAGATLGAVGATALRSR